MWFVIVGIAAEVYGNTLNISQGGSIGGPYSYGFPLPYAITYVVPSPKPNTQWLNLVLDLVIYYIIAVVIYLLIHQIFFSVSKPGGKNKP